MKVNIKTIAQMAGVSVSTVSKIINNYNDVSEETKARVLEIMKQTGYIPSNSAKTLATNKSNLIGVVFAGKLNVDFTHPFFVEVLNSFKKQMGLLGYDLLFFSNEKFHPHGDYLARCLHFQVDGCIIISGDEVESSIDELDQSPIPCIGVDIKLHGKSSGYIMSDNYKMASKVVEHFYLLGYRDLGFIGSRSEISTIRETGYRDAIESFGLPINESWFVKEETFFESSGYAAMKRMLSQPALPRAVFAASDLLAVGAMRALKEHKLRIPEDVAIIGCDDIETCKYTTPTLSTIRQNKEKIGKLSALMLYDLINNQSNMSAFVVEPELVVRESCGGGSNS
ncbi:LacI family DNA-binding transcriptional regulator [Paenibacillus thermoaerophilus]|uniref:LacI family DNA-binding transcriptional regulator n=1 Tax=Paenibacillus thermoaerophilus TaxID=1215385 RepID=A0ABW2V2G7_9BACL|nr:LacI family DNA-binding transcriptional regulator [Paenibacillus thermoaerophilus]TMV08103.1 LacI family transcriptional regulator [Paenibacillus thermoaerophilus]